MRKIVPFLFVIALILTLVSCSNETEFDPTLPPSEGLEFEYDEEAGGYSVIGKGTCKDTTIVIPEKHYDVNVIGIHSRLFAFDDAVKIIIPQTVTTIGESAFAYCRKLKTISIPNSVTSIGKDAFSNCTSLVTIKLPNSITSIEDSLFYNCKKLEKIIIPDSVTSIGDHAFKGCAKLTSISIPNSVKDIGNAAFAECTNLNNIALPNHPINFNYGTGCTESDNFIYNTAYYNNIKNWENGILYIGNHLIKAKKDIIKCDIKEGTFSIASQAFHECKSLKTIQLPDTVTLIGDYAFSECQKLTVIIPNSVTSIGEWAFSQCQNVYVFCEAKSKPQEWNRYWNGGFSVKVYWGNEWHYVDGVPTVK